MRPAHAINNRGGIIISNESDVAKLPKALNLNLCIVFSNTIHLLSTR